MPTPTEKAKTQKEGRGTTQAHDRGQRTGSCFRLSEKGYTSPYRGKKADPEKEKKGEDPLVVRKNQPLVREEKHGADVSGGKGYDEKKGGVRRRDPKTPALSQRKKSTKKGCYSWVALKRKRPLISLVALEGDYLNLCRRRQRKGGEVDSKVTRTWQKREGGGLRLIHQKNPALRIDY